MKETETMKKYLVIISALTLFTFRAAAQEDLSQRPGTFEILGRTDYTMAECGFTKADVASNLEKIRRNNFV